MGTKVHRLKSSAVIHQPTPHRENRFLMLGLLLIDEVDQPEPYTLRFSLTQQEEVRATIEMLPRVERTEAIWFSGGRKGILHLYLRRTESQKQTSADMANGGNVRALRVQDLIASLERSKEIEPIPSLDPRLFGPVSHDRFDVADTAAELGQGMEPDSEG